MGTSPHHHHHHHQQPSNPLITKLFTRVIYALIPLILLHLYLSPFPFNQPQIPHHPTTFSHQEKQRPNSSQAPPRCDYSIGRWVPSTLNPLYNGTTCGTIKDGQNCMSHGRPDAGYLNWRWQPDQCKLRPFDPKSFLRSIQNKHLAFVGDSMARNQLESLLCLLTTASTPRLIFTDGNENKFRRWVFDSHNATVSIFWSPFLVKGVEKSAASVNHNKLYLDSADERWAPELDKIDILVFSIGHWFLHPAIYFDGKTVLGCHHCQEFNHTEVGFFNAFRRAIRTALDEVVRRQRPNGNGIYVVVTTFSPAHFEGEWDKAGACPKTEPYKEGEKKMEYMDAEMHKIELEEVVAAVRKAVVRRGVKIQALDVTGLALMRPDGHPGPYMNPNPFTGGPMERVQNDCVHWCLPGPIDTWNEILMEIMRGWMD